MLGVPFLSACAGPTGTVGGGSSKTLTLALNRSLISLDNKMNQFDAAVTVQRAVRQALTAVAQDLTVEPVLAESFERTGALEWTVRLRENLVYSDGTPVTVEDVKTAIDCYRETGDGSFVGSQFPEWPELTRIDARTFLLTTRAPVVTLDVLMSNILITPAAANKPEELQGGVGSGPYRVERADSGTGRYTLVVNERYWGPDKPSVERVNIEFMPQESSRVDALRSGAVDVIDSIAPVSVLQLEGLSDIAIESVPGTRYSHLFFNFRQPEDSPLNDPRVRRALSWAIDGELIAEELFGGDVVIAEGLVPATLDGYVKTGEFVHDPERCRAELSRLGVQDLSMTLIWESGEWVNDSAAMEALVQMYRDVGVRLRLREFQPGGDINEWRRGLGGDWDILCNGYGNQTGLALTNIQGMYGSTPEMREQRDDYLGFAYSDIAAKVALATETGDRAERNDLLAEVQREVWELAPVLWAFVPNAVLARRESVRDVRLSSINSYPLSAVAIGE
ncbi:ABC transporter substrate-binding protein [Streptomyces sp. DSM 44915]|uniref:ABC transporter substrate-binding protein n=1 Tax=Streptomyces chisholmiae TaxID=3075540 RepID=A0ABU2JRH5_9ACTN|nr:ABC transporter substrate-binding protein [Streptomyces sp. DSM 44915]MDT0267532.1 ABC transporter substrate-binding protein [Streptomyces sp. DSM 44915]